MQGAPFYIKLKQMSACSFEVSFTASKETILAKTKKTMESQGGNFNGDENGGNFNISIMGYTVAGSYTVTGNLLNVLIDEKPVLIPCSAIQSYLEKQLN